MFDGSHRTSRRQVDLSGGGSRRSKAARRKRAAAGGGVVVVSSSSPASAASSSAAAGAAGGGRRAILEESRRLRESRHQQQRRQLAARSVQRRYRGYRCRADLVEGVLDRELLLGGSSGDNIPSSPAMAPAPVGHRERQNRHLAASLRRTTLLLNFRLSFPIDEPRWRRLCTNYAGRISSMAGAEAAEDADGSSGGPSTDEDEPPVLRHRILRATFRSIRDGCSEKRSSPASSSLLPACWVVLRHCLGVDPAPAHQARCWKQLGGARGYVDLLETSQAAAAAAAGSGAESRDDGDSTAKATTARISNYLWELAAVVTPSTAAGKAALAALVLSREGIFVEDGGDDDGLGGGRGSGGNAPLLDSLTRRVGAQIASGNGNGGPAAAEAASGGDESSNCSYSCWNTFYHDWLYSLVRVLTSPATGGSDGGDPMALAARRIESTAQFAILSNVLDLYYRLQRQQQQQKQCQQPPDPAPALRLLQRVLEARSDLSLLSSLAARGEDVMTSKPSVAAAAGGSAVGQRKGDDEDSDDDDDDDDDAMMMDTHVRAPSSAEAAASTRGAAPSRGLGSRLLKQDLLTVPKIDRNYHAEVELWRVGVLSAASAASAPEDTGAVRRLAGRIGAGEQWLHWGLALLSASRDSEELWLAQEAYTALLATMLQSTTGLKARQSAHSPLLTKLAFHQEFVEKLWRYVLVQLTNKEPSQNLYVAFSVFADVFTHRLIALKDDKFLADHTTMQGQSRVILAEHVIVRLRDLLYELYWNRPVRASDVKIPFGRALAEPDRFEAVRGRLLLTGTKLWTALYERWCRLVRHSPFCDESTWLFPHMTMVAGDNSAIVGMRRHPGDAGGDGMDLDSDVDSDVAGGADEPMSTFDAETEVLADAFGDPKMARILTCIPQALPFDRRVKLFSSLLASDKLKTQDEASEMQQSLIMMMRGEEAELSGRERVSIHRDRLYEDSMRKLNKLGPKLRRRVQVTFINQAGHEEAGIDGGGVFKEFIDDLIKDAFSLESSAPSHQRYFTVTSLQTLAVNPALPRDAGLLLHYEFLGRVLGKAVYENILVDPQFCLPFLNQLLGKSNSLEDLKNYDLEYYSNLTKLLSLTTSELESVHLAFETTIGDGASSRVVELVPGGRGKPVTKQNVIQYVHLVAHQRLNVESAAQTKAFLRGFRDLIPASWVRLFSAYELQKLISGDDSIKGINVSSLKAAMQYSAGYHPIQPIIVWFWEILDEMSAEQQRKFLKFMTSCSRQPLLGFASLEPAPCIQQVRLADDVLLRDPAKNAPLPTSSTCMNLLKLPNYKNKELMRSKLLTAIESGAGFELS